MFRDQSHQASIRGLDLRQVIIQYSVDGERRIVPEVAVEDTAVDVGRIVDVVMIVVAVMIVVTGVVAGEDEVNHKVSTSLITQRLSELSLLELVKQMPITAVEGAEEEEEAGELPEATPTL